MRVLVFEFITGGGFVNEDLPASLLHEGRLMRDALLLDLAELDLCSVSVLLDERLFLDTEKIKPWLITAKMNVMDYLIRRDADYDGVWLIAPETDGILGRWTQFFEAQGKLLYGSSSAAIKCCENKLLTLKTLQQAGVACVPTQLFQGDFLAGSDKQILKANRSAGCDEVYVLTDSLPTLKPNSDYIIQPYIPGEALSLSCVCYQGEAWLVCCNKQQLDIVDNQFKLLACKVNAYPDKLGEYQHLCEQVAKAIPTLFGYVGIDFILTEQGELLVLEVNPRLTTSYVGIKQALGLNIAGWVMGLVDNDKPMFEAIKDGSDSVMIELAC